MKVKASSLVLDFNLYPRHHLDEQCIADYVDALKAGEKFPPVIVDKKSNRVVDGFKRTTAALRFGGDDADIEVEVRSYPDQAALLLESISLNANHGMRFSHYDARRCIVLCRQLKIEPVRMAAALRMTPDRLERFAEGIHTGRSGEEIPGKQASMHLVDEFVTKRQADGIRKAGGNNQLFMVNQVINLIESNLLDQSNERLLERLAHLGELLNQFATRAVA